MSAPSRQATSSNNIRATKEHVIDHGAGLGNKHALVCQRPSQLAHLWSPQVSSLETATSVLQAFLPEIQSFL